MPDTARRLYAAGERIREKDQLAFRRRAQQQVDRFVSAASRDENTALRSKVEVKQRYRQKTFYTTVKLENMITSATGHGMVRFVPTAEDGDLGHATTVPQSKKVRDQAEKTKKKKKKKKWRGKDADRGTKPLASAAPSVPAASDANLGGHASMPKTAAAAGPASAVCQYST